MKKEDIEKIRELCNEIEAEGLRLHNNGKLNYGKIENLCPTFLSEKDEYLLKQFIEKVESRREEYHELVDSLDEFLNAEDRIHEIHEEVENEIESLLENISANIRSMSYDISSVRDIEELISELEGRKDEIESTIEEFSDRIHDFFTDTRVNIDLGLRRLENEIKSQIFLLGGTTIDKNMFLARIDKGLRYYTDIPDHDADFIAMPHALFVDIVNDLNETKNKVFEMEQLNENFKRVAPDFENREGEDVLVRI